MFCAAAVFPDEKVEVFAAVVVAEFLAGFDGALGVDEDFVSLYFYLAIRAAGVVDVSREVFSCGTVDGFAVPKLEKILSANTVCLVFCDDIAPVFNNESALGDGNIRKDAQARSAFARHNGECGLAWRVGHKQKITVNDSRNFEKRPERAKAAPEGTAFRSSS